MWLTIMEVHKQTNIPERTIRRYCASHDMFLETVKRTGKPLEFNSKSLDMLIRIKDLYSQGMNAAAINKRLMAEGAPTAAINTASSAAVDIPATTNDAITDLKPLLVKLLKEYRESENRLLKEIQELREEVRQLREAPKPVLEEEGPMTRSRRHKNRGIFSWIFGSKDR